MPSQYPVEKKIEPSLVQRIAEGAMYIFTGKTPSWFGPGDPIQPQAPDDVKGRPFDFQTAWNTTIVPKAEGKQGVPFDILRALAENCDIVRLCIETRKNQMVSQDWCIKPKDGYEHLDEAAKELEKSLKRPDRLLTYRQWMRSLLEDLFVIDAPTIYMRKTVGGDIYALEIVDGATIKILLDENGRTPEAPDPAYQQQLKGIPAVDYTTEELIYSPYNPRPDRAYGMSPVEQIMLTIDMLLKRNLYQLDYYTTGSMPDVLLTAPEGWNKDQISQFQQYWDSLFVGNLAELRKTKIIANGMTPFFTKEKELTSTTDEWLTRIVCFAFSVSPQPFIKEVNRATAETAREAGLQEGLAPLKLWWKDLMDDVLVRAFGVDELEFAWLDEQIIDPMTRANVAQIYIQNGIMTINEVREQLGLAPIANGDQIAPSITEENDGLEAPASQGVPELVGDPDLQDKVSLVEKKNKFIRSRSKNKKPKVRSAIRGFERIFNGYFSSQKEKLVAILRSRSEKLAKIDEDDLDDLLNGLLRELDDESKRQVIREYEEMLAESYDNGARDANKELDLLTDGEVTPYGTGKGWYNEKAVQWARDRAAEKIKEIDDTTREKMRDILARHLEEGVDPSALADEIENEFAFSSTRSMMIARTEAAEANIQGNLKIYEESNVVEAKEWSTIGGDACDDCAPLNGKVVPLGEDFPDGGGDGPPLHPNCRCDIFPVVTKDLD